MLPRLLPSERNPLTYPDAIRAFNRLVMNAAKSELSSLIPELNDLTGDYAVVTTGSDGREEKSYFSPLELVLIHSGSKDTHNIASRLSEKVMNSPHFEEFFEVRDLSKDIISCYNNDFKLSFPSRSLDSNYIAGNPFLAEEYKTKIFDEVNDPKIGKKLVENFDKRRVEAKKILKTGFQKFKGDTLEHFREDGTLFYDGVMVKGSKYGHLRSTQYKIASDILKGMRNGIITDKEFLNNFPSSTTERLNFLGYNNSLNLNSRDINDVTEAYTHALYWYHLAEENYLNRKQVQIQVDLKDFKEVTDILRDFSDRKGNILK